MKKMKFSLGEGGIKGFFARHVEKIVFGLAVLVVLWVALPDSKRKPIDDSQLGPDAIKQTASSAGTRLQTDTAWPLIKGERFKEPDNYLARAERSLIRVESNDYPADTPLNKPLFPLDVKRKDPDIYPIEKIEVAVSYGPVTSVEEGGRPMIRREPVAADGRPLPAAVAQRLSKFGAPAAASGKAEGKYIVSILGQVPLKRQIAEYKARFKDAANYNEARDLPNYGAGQETDFGKYYYSVERAEIAPDGSEGQWKKIGDSFKARKLEATWPSVVELADARYVDPVWTMRLPPLMMRDLRPLALHSTVPSAAQSAEEAAEPEDEGEKDPMDDLDGPVLGEEEEDPEVAVAPRPMPRAPMPRPRRGGNEGYAPPTVGIEDVEYKLFRYIDMDVQPGKAYVYRIQLFIEDPNDPAPPTPKPPLSALDKTVIERLARKPKKSEWWRLSPYSEVSQVVRVPATNQVLAGNVMPKGSPDPDNKVGARLGETMVNVMALVWDEKKAMDVPGTVLAGRGSVLNFKSTVEAIDVANSVLKKLPDYEFQTNNIVLDLRGGETFNRKSDLSSPGEMLLVDDEGNLLVRRELEDQAAFAENTFPAEAKAAEGPIEPETEKKPPRTRPRPSSGEEAGGLLDTTPTRPSRNRDR